MIVGGDDALGRPCYLDDDELDVGIRLPGTLPP